jgi:hypothetical protein
VEWGFFLKNQILNFIILFQLAFLLSNCSSYSENTLYNQPTEVKSLCAVGDQTCLESKAENGKIQITIDGSNPAFWILNLTKERIGSLETNDYQFCVSNNEELFTFGGECSTSLYEHSEINFTISKGDEILYSNENSSSHKIKCKNGRYLIAFPLVQTDQCLSNSCSLTPQSGFYPTKINDFKEYTDQKISIKVVLHVYKLNNNEIPQNLNSQATLDLFGQTNLTNLTCLEADFKAEKCERVCK